MTATQPETITSLGQINSHMTQAQSEIAELLRLIPKFGLMSQRSEDDGPYNLFYMLKKTKRARKELETAKHELLALFNDSIR